MDVKSSNKGGLQYMWLNRDSLHQHHGLKNQQSPRPNSVLEK